MKKRIIAILIVVFIIVLSLDVSGVFQTYPIRFFHKREINKYGDNLVYHASLGGTILFAIRVDEDALRSICTKELGVTQSFRDSYVNSTDIPIYSNESSLYKKYSWQPLKLSGESIVVCKNEKNYAITVKYNRELGIAFFYYDYKKLWGHKEGVSPLSSPRKNINREKPVGWM